MSMTGRYLQLTPAQLETVIVRPELAMDLAYPEDDSSASALDIDKSWHIIHFLLTGEPWGGEGPLASAVLGGTELPGTDAGYGPFRYLTPPEVREVASALEAVPFADLWSRLKPEETEAAEIYPGKWGEDGEVEGQYVSQNYGALRVFYSSASEAGNAVLLYLA
jgi:hypothetical protein